MTTTGHNTSQGPAVPKNFGGSTLPDVEAKETPRSVGELFATMTERISRLFRDEIELAKVQATAKITKSVTGAVFFIVAAVLLLYGLGILLHGFVYLLGEWLPLWAGAFIVFGVLLLIALIFVLIGVKKLKASQEHVIDPKSGIVNDIQAAKKGLAK